MFIEQILAFLSDVANKINRKSIKKLKVYEVSRKIDLRDLLRLIKTRNI